jgi:hypothetical protein
MRKIKLTLQIEEISTKYFIDLINEKGENVSFSIEGLTKKDKEEEAIHLFKILSKYF